PSPASIVACPLIPDASAESDSAGAFLGSIEFTTPHVAQTVPRLAKRCPLRNSNGRVARCDSLCCVNPACIGPSGVAGRSAVAHLPLPDRMQKKDRGGRARPEDGR